MEVDSGERGIRPKEPSWMDDRIRKALFLVESRLLDLVRITCQGISISKITFPCGFAFLRNPRLIAMRATSILCLTILSAVLNSHSGESVQVTQPVSTQLKRTTTQPATVLPYYSAQIQARVEGVAGELLVDLGAEVRKGQELLRLEVPELLKAVERAQAEVLREAAEITRSEAALKVAQARVEQATADIERSEAQVAADQSEFDRASGLVERGVVNAKVKDEAGNRLKAAQAERSSMKQSLLVAKALMAAAAADLDASKASHRVAQKSLEEREVLLGYGTLRAPFDGVITDRHVDTGDLVQKQPLFVVDQVHKLRIRIPVPERDASWLHAGDDVEIWLTARPGSPLQAKLTRVAGGLDPVTRTRIAEVEIPNANGALLPGMYGQATITMQKRQALVVPADAVRHDLSGDAKMVYVVRDGKISHVPVVTGQDDGNSIEIVSGLQASDRIVTGRLGRLADGQSVQILAD